MNKKELWLRLRNYQFNNVVPADLWGRIGKMFKGPDGSLKAFAAKVARKHEWDNMFALKAVHEYKKFVYLGIVSDFNVTPSRVIDVVWHEHILFSKGYREFCDSVIEFTFDHNPELIPIAGQTEQFSLQYLETLRLYETEFGLEPPEDVWGSTKFEKEKTIIVNPQRLKRQADYSMSGNGNSYSTDQPLTNYFEADAGSQGEFSGFDGGDFGGAGSSGGWSDSSGADSGGDSSACSSCSSSCGGGD